MKVTQLLFNKVKSFGYIWFNLLILRFFENVGILRSGYEIEFKKKIKCIIKRVKYIYIFFFEKIEYFSSIYKSGNLSNKLSKMTIYI